MQEDPHRFVAIVAMYGELKVCLARRRDYAARSDFEMRPAPCILRLILNTLHILSTRLTQMP